jgi:hypothetical protein
MYSHRQHCCSEHEALPEHCCYSEQMLTWPGFDGFELLVVIDAILLMHKC